MQHSINHELRASSPVQTGENIKKIVLEIDDAHPVRSERKIRVPMTAKKLPQSARSRRSFSETIGCALSESEKKKPFEQFERPKLNHL